MSNMVPDRWEIGSFSDFATINPKLTSDVTLTPELKVSFIKMEDVSNDAQVKKMHVRNYVEVSKGFTKFNDHDVLVAKITPCFENGKGGYVEHLVNGIGFGSTEFHVLRAKKNTDSKYIYQYTNYDSFRLAAEASMCGTGGQRRVQTDFMKTHKVIFPPLPEQKKIAAILTSVDEVIEKTQAQIDKLKDLKTAMMQELLTCGVGVDGKPHTEFKDSPVGRIPKGWEVVELDTLLNVMESGWSPQCETEKADSGDWCILKTTAVSWDGFNYLANKKLPASLEPRPEIQVKSNNILITRAGPADRVGVVSYVESVPEKVMLSDKIIRLTTKETIHESFLSFWLAGTFAQRFMANRISGLASSQTNISQAILKSIPCVVPSLTEQEIIVNSITSVNNHLRVSIERLSSQQILKKALMQDLLTGKVRVKVD